MPFSLSAREYQNLMVGCLADSSKWIRVSLRLCAIAHAARVRNVVDDRVNQTVLRDDMEQLTAQLCNRDAAPGCGSIEASEGVRLDHDTQLPMLPARPQYHQSPKAARHPRDLWMRTKL
jgi:hypothetical protein